jgi:hypothetical protein
VVLRLKNAMLLLKVSYIVGAILDALVAIQMFIPDLLTLTTGIASFTPGSDFLYASYMSGVMMIGWTVILLWGYKRPVERMDILLVTAFPVVIGLMINDILSATAGFLPWLTATIFLGMQVFLVVLFTISYILNRKTE